MGTCRFEGCKNQAVFSSEFCWDHIDDRNAYREMLNAQANKNTSLKGANLSKVDLSNLNLARMDFSGANLSRANLSGSNLFDANLINAELLGADLSDCDLTSANLSGCDLTRSSLRRARLWHANLENTTLIESDLTRSDLWNADLYNSRFWRTDLIEAISMSKKNFLHKKSRFVSTYRINENGIQSAEEAYRDLKRYFLANGRYDDASWASFKEKTMERFLLKKKKNLAYIPSLIMNMLCGYGEKPHRIVFSSFFVIMLYAAIYFILKAIIYNPSSRDVVRIWDYIYYSVITFTTVGYGDFIPKAALHFRFLAASEAFIGAFMIGLFIFTLARKYSAR